MATKKPEKVNPADDWKDIPGKPNLQVNGLGQLRTNNYVGKPVPSKPKKVVIEDDEPNYMYGEYF